MDPTDGDTGMIVYCFYKSPTNPFKGAASPVRPSATFRRRSPMVMVITSGT